MTFEIDSRSSTSVSGKIDWDPVNTIIASTIGKLEVAWLCSPEHVDQVVGLRCLKMAREIALDCDRLSDDLERRILNLERAFGRHFENN